MVYIFTPLNKGKYPMAKIGTFQFVNVYVSLCKTLLVYAQFFAFSKVGHLKILIN